MQNFAEIGQSVEELWLKKRFSKWRPPLSWILKKSIFGHVIVIGFNIWRSVPNFIKIGRFFTEIWRCNHFTPHKTRTFTVRLAVTTKYQGNGFAAEPAEVLLGRDHPRVVPIGPIVRGVIAFPILGTWWDATTKVRPSRSICRRVMAFRTFSYNDRPPTFNIWSRLSLLSEFAVVYQISSKLVHAFGLRSPIPAECPERRC